MKVRFTKDVATEEARPQKFAKDEVVDFYEMYAAEPHGALTDEEFEKNARQRAEASARHWISRGMAEEEHEEQPRRGRQAPAREQPEQPTQPAQPPAQPKTPPRQPEPHKEKQPATR